MSVVRTQSELQEALCRKESRIIVEEPLAKNFIRKKKKSTIAKIGGAIAIGAGLLALPFTGGASATGIGVGAAAMGLTVGTITISTAELAILVGGGGALCAYGIKKGCKVEIKSPNEIVITPSYK